VNKNLLLVVVVLLAAAGLVWYVYHRHDDCSFSGWKQTVGVDIDVAIGDVQSVKTKLGIEDQQVRDFDTLMKDFALKYDADCQDTKRGRMSQAEYLCRRNNMDKTLDKIRIFLEKVEAAKTLPDPATQRGIVLKALDDLETATKSGYGAGCTSAMVVDPKQLNFNDHTSERAVQVSNSGNNPLVFTAGSLPNGFIAQPKTGNIAPGNLAVIAVYRTFEPVVPGQPLTFHMLSNFQEDVSVQIDLDAQNSELYDSLADQARTSAAVENHPPTLQDALAVVDQSLAKSGPVADKDKESMRYFLAAGVLTRVGNIDQAHQALDAATSKNPSLAKEPSALILRGIVVNQEGHPDRAIQHFAEAKRLAPEDDKATKGISDLLTGAVVLKTDKKTGSDLLAKADVQKSVQRNPKLLDFATRELRVDNLDKAVKNAASGPH
jgi:tetratricopeptide (TPR) repeat protein